MGPTRLQGDAITFRAPSDPAFAGAAEACAHAVAARAGFDERLAQRFASGVRDGFEQLSGPVGDAASTGAGTGGVPEPVTLVVRVDPGALQAELGRRGRAPVQVRAGGGDQRPV